MRIGGWIAGSIGGWIGGPGGADAGVPRLPRVRRTMKAGLEHRCPRRSLACRAPALRPGRSAELTAPRSVGGAGGGDALAGSPVPAAMRSDVRVAGRFG